MKNSDNRRRVRGRAAAFLLAAALCFSEALPLPGLMLTSFAYTEQNAVVLASSLNVWSGPGTGYTRAGTLVHGASVVITDEVMGDDGKVWAAVRYQGTTGYVQKSYLRIAASYTHDESFEAELSSQGFPESYKERLRQIHASYPSWRFTAYQTGLDWNDAITNESVIGRNLVHESSRSSWKSTETGAFDWAANYWPGFDSSAWVAASEDVIRYYMDPRNFLDSAYVFQFLVQSYDAGTQTASGVETLVQGTFMEGRASSNYQGQGAGSGPDSMQQEPGSSPGDAPQQGTDPGSGSVSAPDSGAGQVNGGSENGTVSQSSTVSQNSGSAPESGGGAVVGAAPGSAGSGSSQAAGQPQGSSGGQAPSSQQESISHIGVITGAPGAKAPDLPDGFYDTELLGTLEVRNYAVVGHSSGSYHDPDPGSSGNSGGPGGPGGGSSSGSSGSGGGSAPSGVNYVDLIMQAAASSGVNPYVLTSMIIQEQGTKGTSGLISGTNSAYPGIYNFFNVNAYADSSMSAITRGLWWASQSGAYGRPWNSIEKAVIGGADYYGENFIRAGQDTFYLKKFNVTSNNRYQHQYMTNVEGAAAEGFKLGEAYSEALKQQPLLFRIPVYSGMPNEPERQPTGDGSPNNKLKQLSLDGFTLTPGFDMNQENYDLTVDTSVEFIDITAIPVDSSATVTGNGGITLSGHVNTVTVQVTAGNGAVRNYTINISRQNGGQAGNGNHSYSVPDGGNDAPDGGQGGPGMEQSAGGGPGGGTVGPSGGPGIAPQAEITSAPS